jgi:hypothetical protein
MKKVGDAMKAGTPVFCAGKVPGMIYKGFTPLILDGQMCGSKARNTANRQSSIITCVADRTAVTAQGKKRG